MREPLLVLDGNLKIASANRSFYEFFHFNAGTITGQSVYELGNRQWDTTPLRGLLPICMNCKKIRNDKGYWEQVDQYISDRSSVTFSHGLCPDCFTKTANFLREMADNKQSNA